MLILLDSVARTSLRTLRPYLSRHLSSPVASTVSWVEESGLDGDARLERLLSEVLRYNPLDRVSNLVLDGWVFSPVDPHRAPTDRYVARSLALTRLAARLGAVRLLGDPPVTSARRFLWDRVTEAVPGTLVKPSAEACLEGLLAVSTPASSAQLAYAEARGVGTPSPQVVLVGEGTSRFTWRGLPFSGGQSTRLLNEALAGTTGIYLLNATDLRAAETHVLSARVPTPRFVALGEEASAFLTGLGVDHARVLHPAHVLRFCRAGAADWVARLRALLE